MKDNNKIELRNNNLFLFLQHFNVYKFFNPFTMGVGGLFIGLDDGQGFQVNPSFNLGRSFKCNYKIGHRLNNK